MSKKIFMLLFTLVGVWGAAVTTADAQAPLFSNYGYKNLSYATGVTSDIELRKVVTALDGNTLYVAWADNAVDKVYKVWMRRSTDLGMTWEDPVEVFATANSNHYENRRWKMMAAADGRVHFILTDGNDLVYLRSADGKTFSRQVLDTETNSWGHSAAFVDAVDGKVAICYQSNYNSPRNGVHLAYSHNAGETFTDTIVSTNYNGEGYSTDLYSFKYDGKTMAAMSTWNDRWGDNHRLWVSTSRDAKTIYSTEIATDLVNDNGTVTHHASYGGGDYSAMEPYTKVAVNGDKVYVLTSELLTREDGTWYVALHRSLDGGQTWLPAQQICSETYKPAGNGNSYICVKGNDVYVLTQVSDFGQYEVRNLVFHSHDSGETFNCQSEWTETTHVRGHIADYTLAFDPSDATGKTIYLAGNDYSWVKTTDGFKTIDEVSLNDTNCPDGVGFWNNLYTNLEIDKDGIMHWFIRYRPRDAKRHELIYRRAVGEPYPLSENKAFNVVAQDNGSRNVNNRVLIPNNKNFHGSAVTIEMWVKPETTKDSQVFAQLSYNYEQNTRRGFCFGTKKGYSDEDHTFIASFINEKEDMVDLRQTTPYVQAGKWYHLALTYDEEQHHICFYVNGVLADEKEFFGTIGWGWNPIVLGTCTSYPSTKDNFTVDDFRLWNRALTAEEIQTNLSRNITTAEDLKINIGFDGTLLDLSGNGNNGYGMADVDFVDAARQLPQAVFDFFHSDTGEVVFTNRSTDAVQYLWHFGDGTTSEQSQPTHVYKEPGDYLVTLEAFSATASASVSQRVVIAGLAGISPTKAGNAGILLLTVMGGGLSESSKVCLRHEGKEVAAEASGLIQPGILRAMLPMDGTELGKWDVVVDGRTLQGALTVEEAIEPKPWVNITGRDICLYNKWQTYTIHYGNEGNVDAYNVPINLFITNYPETEVECIDFRFQYPDLDPDVYGADKVEGFYSLLDSKDPFEVFTDADGQEWRGVSIIVPVVPAGSSSTMHIRVKSPEDFTLRYWTRAPWGFFVDDEASGAPSLRPVTAEQWEENGYCIWKYLAWGATGVVADAVGIGCAYTVGKTAFDLALDSKAALAGEENSLVKNFAWNMGSSAVSCLLGELEAAAKIGWMTMVGISALWNTVANVSAAKDCNGGPDNNKSVDARGSWDPNEMVGPSGYRDDMGQFWIKSVASMPYTILFENKAEATAPAHTVFVSDTLDLAKYDLDGFNFTSVGWGDTIVNIVGGSRKEFVKDIDLRPAKPFIVRTSGKLHPETGIVEWNFITLNPVTMQEEEDPEIGFLPPNDDNHAGEGFVSFVIGQKHLASGTKIANQASIVFDANAPILTNTYVNAIDDDLPTSAAYLVTEEEGKMKVQWSGSDKSSGVAHYEVWMCKNRADFEKVTYHDANESILVDIDPFTTYGFFTLVTDNVGNMEDKSPLSEVTYTPSAMKKTMAADARLLTESGHRCEIILPYAMQEVRMTVQAFNGQTLATQQLGSGERFNVILPVSAGILVIEAAGQKFVWKVATE